MEANIIKYSEQQQALVDFAQSGKGNALVNAVAGSGKTSTLFGVLKVAPAGATVATVAYNKKISVEFENGLSKIKDQIAARVTNGTVHKFGLSAWRRLHPKVEIEGDKCIFTQGKTKIAWMMENYVHPKTHQQGVPFEFRYFISKAYNLARQSGAGVLNDFPFARAEAWWNLVDHFDLRDEFEDSDGNLPPNVDEMVKEAINWTVYMIKYGIELAPRVIDFEDMIYMPLRYNLTIWTYDWILVDEVQDINPTRRAFLKKMMGVGGRAFFVGDPRQAIYGFTGADARSFENIRSEFACKDLPLTWSFRCPKSVVKHAQQWVGHIKSTPDAPEGTVSTIDASTLLDQALTDDDAIICRNNVPLVELFFMLLRKGIGAHIEGKDIGDGLVRLIQRYPKIKTIDTLETKLVNYKNRAIQKATAAGKENKAAEITDYVDAILAVMHNLPAGTQTTELVRKIRSMFQDEQGKVKKTLTLTSSHKSKGREWNRVFWYGFNRFNPSPFARQDWQIEQEANLCYVTTTRAKDTLVLVTVSAT